MSCGINNPVVVVYDVNASGIKMPSRYDENNLVGDMLRMMEIPINDSIADEPTIYDEDAEPTDTPLVPVVPGLSPAPISLPSTTTSVPTVEITTSMLVPPPTTSSSSTPNAIVTSTIPETTSSTGAVEYFTNKLKCTDKKNYLIFGVVISIFILVIVLVLQKNK
jgi:hypothetical protein